jgi:hypothetical protein
MSAADRVDHIDGDRKTELFQLQACSFLTRHLR